MIRARERWICGECGTLYDSELNARACCQPDVTHAWECPRCGECSGTFESAAMCCDDTPIVTTAAELETAGQERMPW